MNKAILIGHLGADPDSKFLATGTAVCEFRLATSESWKDKDGKRQERTEWHRIVAWGKTAELCGKYLSKGRQVCVEGRIQTRTYEKDGQKRYTTEIVADHVEFLSSAKDRGEQSTDAHQPPPPPPPLDDLPF